MRLKPATFLLAPLLLLGASNLRAEYVVLRSGQRLHVTGYQLIGDKYRLQIPGGWVDATAQDVVRIEPEDTFAPVPPQAQLGLPPRPWAPKSARRWLRGPQPW